VVLPGESPIKVESKISRMDLGEVAWDDVDWIGLGQDRNRWRALVNSVLNFGFHEMLGNSRVV
jgi:hypothetical protein